MGVINENQAKINKIGPWLFNSNEKGNKKNISITEKFYISPKSQYSLSTTIDDIKSKELQKNLIYIFQNKKNSKNNSKIAFKLSNLDKNKNLYSNNIQKYKSSFPILKEYPSNKPNLYNNIYTLSEDNLSYFSKRNDYAKINKFTIPTVFYNHLMIKTNENNKFYITCSITKRTKGKLITYIYYYPQRKYSK